MAWRVALVALAAVTVGGFLLSPTVDAGELAFRRHVLNADATYSAAAAFDVNGDGKMDVVSGGFWYQAPDWKRHFLRDVEVIRGRFDDYSNLPLDVDGDGRLDVISANFRSQTLYWVQHPGANLNEPWPRHVVEMPGPMETARLEDIDGDGRLDVLPNGTTFAAWWEVGQQLTSSGQMKVRWSRHELPKDVAGHGVGFGDLDGDGRGDIIGPRGYLAAPEDRRAGRWIWRPEFELHRDASVPILVWDVDGDGDNDVVWARAHTIGLYWLEQGRTDAGERTWTKHAIDTSWSQAHAPMLADLDGDGQIELVAGKRYMGHDGNDPGEYDPLVVYSYQFDPAARTWQRRLINWGEGVGFGLDPKAIDLDADGDVDLVCPGRSGLYVLENLRIAGDAARAAATSAMPEAPEYSDHSRLLVYKDPAGKEQPVATPFDWAQRRAHILANMERVMGSLPEPARRVPLDVQIVSQEKTPRYLRRKITYAVEPGDRVPAYLLLPYDRQTRGPAMLCLHPTSPLGKDQLVGLGGLATRHYAHELANRGYVCLVPDYPSFGEYKDYDFAKARDHYASGTMKAIWNNIRGVDLLESLPEVNPDQIGAIGHSLGGHNALYTAAFDQRIVAVATSCGFNAFHDYYGGDLKGWTSDRYMPRIRDVYQNDPDRMPFDFHEVIAALAPRPVFINAPKEDANFAVVGVEKVVASAAPVFELRKSADRLVVHYPDCGHDFPDEIREACYAWLDGVLKK